MPSVVSRLTVPTHCFKCGHEKKEWLCLECGTQQPLCGRCKLCEKAQNLVVGDIASTSSTKLPRVLWIGEAPGADEDRRARPFVGASGKLLDLMMATVGINRSEQTIVNTIKCRPPNNKIDYSYVRYCAAWLEEQFWTVKPHVVVTLGRVARAWLQDRCVMPEEASETSLTDIQGSLFRVNTVCGTVLWMPMFHPSAIQRDYGRRGAYEGSFRRLAEAIQSWKTGDGGFR